MTAPEKAFVNLFWGQKDDGFLAIQMRIKTSLRTLHELLEFYKERVAIEKEYNKRLSKLASSVTLGSNEVGSLKIALDKLQNESGNMIAQNQTFIRSVLVQNYEKLHQFYQVYHKHTSKLESHMAKVLQKKHDYALYLENSKEKFRVTCGQQKTLTLLCQTTWGKELEKNTAKLHKVQQAMGGAEENYQQAVRKYAEIHEIWVRDWSISLLNIYQLEIERIQICKLNCFAFCNHIASLCVEWDLAVDNARSTFAKVGAPRDVADFVDAYGTGSQIAVPPDYVDFASGHDDDGEKFTIAEFKDPDYTQILSRTFSTHSNIVARPAPTQIPEANAIKPVSQTPNKPAVNKTLPPIKEPLSPSAKKTLEPAHLSVNPPQTQRLGEALKKQPSHNSNYTSGAEDRHEIFDRQPRMHNSNTLSDYSSPTNYSAHTGRSWSSPRKKLAQEVQKEINRRLQDLSELLTASPKRAKAERRNSVPLAKDFSIDFIAKALEDLNAGGDGDMNKFRRSVRLENEQAVAQAMPALDLVDDSQETARRYESISFRSPERSQMARVPTQNSVSFAPAADDLLQTVVKTLQPVIKSNETHKHKRSLLQSPTKSYTNLQALVEKITPVTRNQYVTKAVARYSYKSREPGELTFKKGWHMYVIHKQEDNWYVCELAENCGGDRGLVGLVPYNYVVEGDQVF